MASTCCPECGTWYDAASFPEGTECGDFSQGQAVPCRGRLSLVHGSWAVIVERDDESVIAITSESVSARELRDGDAHVIRIAALQLLSFVGPQPQRRRVCRGCRDELSGSKALFCARCQRSRCRRSVWPRVICKQCGNECAVTPKGKTARHSGRILMQPEDEGGGMAGYEECESYIVDPADPTLRSPQLAQRTPGRTRRTFL